MTRPLRPILALLAALSGCAESAPASTAPPPPPNAPLLGQPVPDGPPGIGAVDPHPSSFTKFPGQQIPDERLRGEPRPAEAAMAESRADLARQTASPGAVPVPGVEPHGIAQRDPATTYGHCLKLLTTCAERSGSMDTCVERVPTCARPRPWEVDELCCPAPCVEAYRSARAGGTAWAEAFLRSVIQNRGCFPGLAAVYGEGSP